MDLSCGFIIEACQANWRQQDCNATDTHKFTEIPGSCRRGSVRLSQGYMLSFDVSQQWRLEQGHFVRQLEGYICGLIACTKINNVHSLGTIRNLVTEQWKRFLIHCASKGGNMMSQAYTRTFNPLDICFCFNDESHMDIVHLVCCKQFIHRDCLMTWLKFEGSFPYCRQTIDDITSI